MKGDAVLFVDCRVAEQSFSAYCRWHAMAPLAVWEPYV